MKKKGFAVFLAAIFVFLCAGCGQKKTHEEDTAAITAVLTRYFTAPDEELSSAAEAPGNVLGEGVPGGKQDSDKMGPLMRQRYGAYFSDSGLAAFTTAYAGGYPVYATNKGDELKAEKVDVTPTKSGYDFTVTVSCGEPGGAKDTFTVTGGAQCGEEHKITSLRFYSDGGLSERLKP